MISLRFYFWLACILLPYLVYSNESHIYIANVESVYILNDSSIAIKGNVEVVIADSTYVFDNEIDLISNLRDSSKSNSKNDPIVQNELKSNPKTYVKVKPTNKSTQSHNEKILYNFCVNADNPFLIFERNICFAVVNHSSSSFKYALSSNYTSIFDKFDANPFDLVNNRDCILFNSNLTNLILFTNKYRRGPPTFIT